MSFKKNTSIVAIALAGAMSMTLPGIAYASGGGGGGGGGGGFNNAPSNRPTINVAEVYRTGVEQYKAGDYKAAQKSLKSVTGAARKSAPGHYMLGLTYMAQENWRSAASSLKTSLKYDKENFDARAQLGLAYLKRDKTKDAAKQMAELEKRMAECGEACPTKLVRATETLRAAMSPEAAPEEVAALYTPVPVSFTVQDGDAAYLDAVRLINIGDYDEALGQLRQAEKVFGPHPDVLTYIGFANRKAGNYDQAIHFYSAALELQPTHVGANEYLGEYYVELGDMDAAYSQLAKLEEICDFGCAETDELRTWIETAETS